MTRRLTVDPLPGFSRRVGEYAAMLEDVRRRTKTYVEGLSAPQLAWHPQENVESIGTVLLQIAAVEVSYIQEDILRQPMAEAEWGIAFPIRLGIPQVSGEPLEFYTERMDRVRAETLRILAELTDRDLAREVAPLDPGPSTHGPVTYTIEWILYHLIEHEAHHKGQIAVMKRLVAS